MWKINLLFTFWNWIEAMYNCRKHKFDFRCTIFILLKPNVSWFRDYMGTLCCTALHRANRSLYLCLFPLCNTAKAPSNMGLRLHKVRSRHAVLSACWLDILQSNIVDGSGVLTSREHGQESYCFQVKPTAIIQWQGSIHTRTHTHALQKTSMQHKHTHTKTWTFCTLV